jgi:hypothetical protein
MTDLATSLLDDGDHLDILRRHLPETCVDLVYLDPPFNSNGDDNVIFRDESDGWVSRATRGMPATGALHHIWWPFWVSRLSTT